MSHQWVAGCAVMAVMALTPVLAAAQSTNSPPRTPWGDPDLQGTWTNTTTTPLERPVDLGDQELYTEEERVELDETAHPYVDREPPPGCTGAYNSFWFEAGRRSRRTSLVVDPPDGRVPFTPAEREKADKFAADINAEGLGDTWEDRNMYERCITRGMPGAMMPGFYNHNYQILQTPDYVVVMVEMSHDARIIPLDGRGHIPASIGEWLGDSRGRWEGDTLVVETTHFTGRVTDRGLTVFGTGKDAHLVERFTRVDDGTIDYQLTVTDAAVFTKPWTAEIPLAKTEGPIFEYACYEGNYGMKNILAGRRAAEAEAASVK